jgi:hypothetical protein
MLPGLQNSDQHDVAGERQETAEERYFCTGNEVDDCE